MKSFFSLLIPVPLTGVLFLLAGCGAGDESVFTTVGILLEKLVNEGDSVVAGQPLFKIDNTVSELTLANARLAMERLADKSGSGSTTLLELESRMNLAYDKFHNDSLLFERQQRLWDQNVGSKLEYEKRELTYKSSETEYKNAKLQYEQVKADLEKEYRQSQNNYRISQKQQTDYILKSSIDGIVYSINKDPGELITTATPVAVVGESGAFEIELQVDEFDIVKVKPGQNTFLSMDSYKGDVFEARITRIEPYMNSRTRTFTVWAEFTNIPPVLYPNLSVEANILIQKKENALTIPAGYLIGNNKLLISPEDTITVKTGIVNMQWVEITEGLKENQEVYLPSR